VSGEALFAIASLTRPEREERVRELVRESYDTLSAAIYRHILRDDRQMVANVILFSGGNDSTVLGHLFREHATHTAHANTGVGIEETRVFVRNVSEEWGIPLLERRAPREVDHYRNLVLTRQRGKQGQALGGFPGPAMHFKMFARLKERALEQVRRELVDNPRRERVVFLAGRRRSESKRRANVPAMERRGSTVWVSPLVNWTKLDLNTYRLMQGDVPVNEVSDLIHMSGECLCGAMASPGERMEVSHWYPGAFSDIAEMEAELVDRDDIPEHRKVWGWGADPIAKAAEDAYLARFKIRPDYDEDESLFLCDSCSDRFGGAA
jgi:3'-phosphoadenosine 5'-phosphosulfate sulfotransferase (PAPS reductase)/FAD synthetase